MPAYATEICLSHNRGKTLNWKESAYTLPEFVTEINEGNSFEFDSDFIIRCLFVVSDLGSKFDIDILRKKTNVAGRLKRSFTLGLLQGLQEKLQLNDKQQSLPGTVLQDRKSETISALVVAKDNALADFVESRFPRMRKIKYRSSGVFCGSTYRQGKKEGKKITIHKVMKHKDGNLGKLISA